MGYNNFEYYIYFLYTSPKMCRTFLTENMKRINNFLKIDAKATSNHKGLAEVKNKNK